MSQPALINPHTFSENQSIHLPKSNDDKTRLYRHIDQYINQLKQEEGNDQKIDLLNMRKKLISKHGLSVERIDNLELIFLHYCSHIFKTGKHMTFERLEYEKNHMTMDRFFVFLKDFGLTTASIDGVNRQIFDKNELVLIFKKASVNCKDLNFEQFISCLEKIALLYYDAKTHYKEKQQKIARERQKRREHYLKSVQRRKAALERAQTNNEEGQEQNENEQHVTDQEDNHEEEQSNKNQEPEENENDKLVDQLINDKEITDPEAELRGQEQNNENKEETAELQEKDQNNQHLSEFDREQLLELSLEEKIEYFYELINVDNATSFKKKMRQLNLPLFQTKHKRVTSHAEHVQSHARPPRLSEAALEEQQRLQQLRNLIEERKERDKHSSPQMNKEDYQERRKKRKVEEEKVISKKYPRKKRIEVNQLETDLSSLSKMEFDKINFRKFNPQKLYQPSEEDDIYLQEYYTSRKPGRASKRVLSSLESSDKNSQLLLQRLKKRAHEIEAREKLEESKYEIPQDMGASTEHQLRKNRLVEKLLKMHKS